MDKNSFANVFKGSTSQRDIDNLRKLLDDHEDEEASIVMQIFREMESDGDDDSFHIWRLYQDANDDERAIMDALLVSLCGWTMHTLIEKLEESLAEHTE